MPKIFGIGLPKTGTTSLNEALKILGYKSIHMPWAWRRQIYNTGKYVPPNAIERRGWDAVTNFAEWFFPQMDALYPGSKFILTVRPVEPWLRSVRSMYKRATAQGAQTLIDVFGTRAFHEARCRQVLVQHCEFVRRYFMTTDRFRDSLVMIEPFTWEPLCAFLRKPVPDVPYPHLNRTKDKRVR